jgi:uncharacterized membrane protein
MFAAYRETGYNVMLFLHIACALVAFAPAAVHPLLVKQTSSIADGPMAEGRRRVLQAMAGNGRRVYAPALILVGLFGFAMQGMSDSVIEFGQTWFWLSIVLWLAMNGVLHAMLLPAERALAAGDEGAESKVDLGGLILTVLLLVVLYLMVFKPGF